MQENNDRESKEGESNEESSIVLIRDNPAVSMTGIFGLIFVGSEDGGYPPLEKWAEALLRDEPVEETVDLHVRDDRLIVGFGDAAEISPFPLCALFTKGAAD